MKYNEKQMSKAEYIDLVKAVSARNINKLYNAGKMVCVGLIVDNIMKRSDGADRREVLSLVYAEFLKFINDQPKGSFRQGFLRR